MGCSTSSLSRRWFIVPFSELALLFRVVNPEESFLLKSPSPILKRLSLEPLAELLNYLWSFRFVFGVAMFTQAICWPFACCRSFRALQKKWTCCPDEADEFRTMSAVGRYQEDYSMLMLRNFDHFECIVRNVNIQSALCVVFIQTNKENDFCVYLSYNVKSKATLTAK